MPRFMQYTKGAVPYFAGDQDERIFILQQGSAVLTSEDIENGKSVTSQVSAGEFFGVKSALGHFPREETVSILSDAAVVVLTVSEFEKLFSGNKQLIMKMLRVFSNQLRQIHKKIGAVLNVVPEEPPLGMFDVAQSFYNDNQFRSCCDVCIKILKRFPQSSVTSKVKGLYENARIRNEKMRSREVLDEAGADVIESFSSSFTLPAFERFSKAYEPGQVIISEFEPGDTFYLIQSGAVQLIKCVNGTKKNLDILKAGEFFGEMAILDNSPRSATCVAKTRVKCLEFSKENFEVLITGNPQLALNLLKLFCKRIYDQKRRFRILVIKDPQVRLADVFIMLSEMSANVSSDDRICKLTVTIADMAQWAGLSLDVTRAEIYRFVEKRKIEVFDNYIVVLDIADMKRIARNVL